MNLHTPRKTEQREPRIERLITGCSPIATQNVLDVRLRRNELDIAMLLYSLCFLGKNHRAYRAHDEAEVSVARRGDVQRIIRSQLEAPLTGTLEVEEKAVHQDASEPGGYGPRECQHLHHDIPSTQT